MNLELEIVTLILSFSYCLRKTHLLVLFLVVHSTGLLSYEAKVLKMEGIQEH